MYDCLCRAAAFVVTYSGLRTAYNYTKRQNQSTIAKQIFWAREAQIVQKAGKYLSPNVVYALMILAPQSMLTFCLAVSLTSTVFTVATILFVRNCLKPFKCTLPDIHGQIFMVSNPEIECSDDNAEYVSMRTMGSWCAACGVGAGARGCTCN